MANKVVTDILNDASRSTTITADRAVFFVNSTLYSNGGLKFSADGILIGFVEPN